MSIARQSTTNTLTFDEVITRLAQQGMIDGLIVVGSAAQEQLTAVSDYDLVIILSTMPVPLHVGMTYIDGRFADLIFHTTDQIEQILVATTPFAFWDWVGRLVGWLATGKVVFDRQGQLGQAQAKVQSGAWLQPISDRAAYNAWQSINYNLQVVRRYLASADPTYLLAADMRMLLFGPQDLFFNYFAVRGLPPDSEKNSIRYLQVHDPAYLTLFQRFLLETDRQAKFHYYEQVAMMTLAPVGGLWRTGETIMNIDAQVVTPAMETSALDFWEGLVSGSQSVTPGENDNE